MAIIIPPSSESHFSESFEIAFITVLCSIVGIPICSIICFCCIVTIRDIIIKRRRDRHIEILNAFAEATIQSTIVLPRTIQMENINTLSNNPMQIVNAFSEELVYIIPGSIHFSSSIQN